MKEKICSKCGNQLNENDLFCPKCGMKIVESSGNIIRKCKTIIRIALPFLPLVMIVFIIILGMVVTNSVTDNVIDSDSENYSSYLKDEDDEIVRETIQSFAEKKRSYQGTAVKYNSYSKYRTTSNGKIVYKICYSTSYSWCYYYQLVSLNSFNTDIDKSTDLFFDSQTLELEYAYDETW